MGRSFIVTFVQHCFKMCHYITHVGQMTNKYNILVARIDEKRHFWKPSA